MAVEFIAHLSMFLFFLCSCHAKPENFIEAQCHVLQAGEGTASEYRVKASEKGVRIVYLDLKLSLSYQEPSQKQKALHGLSITFNRGRLIHSQDSFLAGYEIKTFC